MLKSSYQLECFLSSWTFFCYLCFSFSMGIFSKPERNTETKKISLLANVQDLWDFIRLNHTSLLTLLLFPLLSSPAFSSALSPLLSSLLLSSSLRLQTLQMWILCLALVGLSTALVCPDGGMCEDKNTCCKNTAGGYGCCPLPHVSHR